VDKQESEITVKVEGYSARCTIERGRDTPRGCNSRVVNGMFLSISG
jgi:hypothetical protein